MSAEFIHYVVIVNLTGRSQIVDLKYFPVHWSFLHISMFPCLWSKVLTFRHSY